MTVFQRLKEPRIAAPVGMVFLVLGLVWHWFVHPSASISETAVDGLGGLWYGIAIGFLMVSLWRKGLRRSDS